MLECGLQLSRRAMVDKIRLGSAGKFGHEPVVLHVSGLGNFKQRDFSLERFDNLSRHVGEVLNDQQHDARLFTVDGSDDSHFLVGFKNEFDIRDVLGTSFEINRLEFHWIDGQV